MDKNVDNGTENVIIIDEDYERVLTSCFFKGTLEKPKHKRRNINFAYTRHIN